MNLDQKLLEIGHLVRRDNALDERTRLLIVQFWRHVDAQLDGLTEGVTTIMATIAEIKAAVDATLAKATANTDALASVRDLIAGLKASISDLQTQLAEAIANDDPAAVQAVADGLTALNEKLDEQAAAEAALANTT